LKIETSVKQGDPRNISPRSDEFLSIIGPYIAQIEAALHDHKSLVKGLSMNQRNHKIRTLTGYSHFIETDYSRFDTSISIEYLEQVEYLFLTTPFMSDEHWLFRQALRMAHHTFGVSDLGISYSIPGTRCSGDAHTSIGNGLINHFNTWLALEPLPADSWTSFHEGDDGIIGVAEEFIDQACYNMHLMPSLGFQLKMDRHNDLTQTSFCGRFLAADKDVIVSICDLKRTLAKLHTSCSDGDPMSLIVAKAMSYYHTDKNTPILGAFCTTLISLYLPYLSKRRIERAIGHLRTEMYHRFKSQNLKSFYTTNYAPVEPSAVKRALVALRCGYTPATQIAYEQYYYSFLRLGYLPSNIDRIPEGWTLDHTAHIHGPVSDFVL